MSLMLNIFLCLDLILVISNPFSSSESRLNYYLIFSFIPALFWSYTAAYEAYVDEYIGYISRLSAIAAICLFWLIALFSIAFGLIKLCRPGIS